MKYWRRPKAVESVAEALKPAGVETMPVPENYHDDLVARFSLPSETISRMRLNGLLYEEDDFGSFFQLYTYHFRRRFAFEIVERHGYRGFGAPNAPVRPAMQRLELMSVEGG